MKFGMWNWIVVVVYLLGMVAIGYWFMKREASSSTEAYFRGGQKIPFWVAGLSIFATMLSAITFMAVPGVAYAKNWNGYIGQWIETISSRIDPSTRSILSRIVVDNSNFEIIPGQLMTVKIIYDEIQQIGVPESAVTIQGDTAFVYTVTDGFGHADAI